MIFAKAFWVEENKLLFIGTGGNDVEVTELFGAGCLRREELYRHCVKICAGCPVYPSMLTQPKVSCKFKVRFLFLTTPLAGRSVQE